MTDSTIAKAGEDSEAILNVLSQNLHPNTHQTSKNLDKIPFVTTTSKATSSYKISLPTKLNTFQSKLFAKQIHTQIDKTLKTLQDINLFQYV